MPVYLRGHPLSSTVLPLVWQSDPQLVVRWMVRLYLEDRSFLSRILDIAQDLKVLFSSMVLSPRVLLSNFPQEALTRILEAEPFHFSIQLATLASRREFLNLDKWLQLRLVEHGDVFASACLNYIAEALGQGGTSVIMSM